MLLESGTMLAKTLSIMTNARIWRGEEAYRTATELASEESCAEQVRRRRAARWHAWLTSPECTFQDRENFERWCSDATNAAAYVAFCANLAAFPDCESGGDDETEFRQAASALASPGNPLRLQADAP